MGYAGRDTASLVAVPSLFFGSVDPKKEKGPHLTASMFPFSVPIAGCPGSETTDVKPCYERTGLAFARISGTGRLLDLL
jgi:hypothetical protein